MKPSQDDRFNLELLKLLVQVAWGDDQLDPHEADAIYGLGRSWFVPEGDLDGVRDRLRAGKQLPAPDLGLLRKDPAAVLEAVRALVAVDGRLVDAERDILEEIKVLLGESA